MRHHLTRARSGFTFIELMCVISIIAILAAILFPVFAQAREKARQTSCMSNLQQLAIAMNLYAQDHNGRFPVKDDDYAPVLLYVKNYGIFRCPSDPVPGPAQKQTSDPPPWELAATDYTTTMPTPPFSTSYNYRGGLHSDDWGDIPFIGERVLMTKGDAYTPPSWIPGPGAQFQPAFYHSGGANRVTICGSVKWFKTYNWVPINDAQKKQMIALRDQAKRSGTTWPVRD